MITEEKNIDYEIYNQMFMDYEKPVIDHSFSNAPYSINPLLDVYKRIKQLPVYFRKTFQVQFNWTLVRFYRKMKYSSGRFDIIYSGLKFNEKDYNNND